MRLDHREVVDNFEFYPIVQTSILCATAEHPYELAMYLHLLIDNVFPTWPEVFGMAEKVMNRLGNEDPILFAHLHSSFTKNALIDPKVRIH